MQLDTSLQIEAKALFYSPRLVEERFCCWTLVSALAEYAPA